jgi:hypothetical protein
MKFGNYSIELDLWYSADPSWLILPKAKVKLEVWGPHSREIPADGVPNIYIRGNTPGIITLANVLLWLAGPEEYEYLSISALPFVSVSSRLRLLVCLDAKRPSNFCTLCQRLNSDDGGTVRVTDNDMEYEWQIHPAALIDCAVSIHREACELGAGRHHHMILTADSDCGEIIFFVEDI